MAAQTAAELAAMDTPTLAHDSSTNAMIGRYRQLRQAQA